MSKKGGVATWKHMNAPHGARVCVREYVCARVCSCAYLCVSVTREIKHPFQDNAFSLNTYTLYTRRISLIYVM